MYDLHDYARMIADPSRMGPYVRALEECCRPGSVVVDVGAGTGILALVACRLGARRVFAIETNDVIEVGPELARENGCADRIVFLQGDVLGIELPERADVVVSDLRGMLPLYSNHIAVVADVRERFLKPGGVLLPTRDRLIVAVVENRELHERALGPVAAPRGVTLEAMRARLRHLPLCAPEDIPVRPTDVVSTASGWATIDYASARPGPFAGRAELRVERAAVAHGLVVWFEAIVAGDYGFSSAPGEDNSYGQLFLPWPRPVPVAVGDTVAVDLWTQAEGAPWGWNSAVRTVNGHVEAFKQSSFLGAPGRLVARGGHGAAGPREGRSLAKGRELA